LEIRKQQNLYRQTGKKNEDHLKGKFRILYPPKTRNNFPNCLIFKMRLETTEMIFFQLPEPKPKKQELGKN
jgi:hypothetical protein